MKIYLVIATLSFVVVVLLNLFTQRITAEAPPIPPAPELAQFHLGYNQTLADSYWLRFLQDVEYCGPNARSVEDSLSADGKRVGPNRLHGCEFGWSYHMLNQIIELDPRFHFAGSMGPLSLSIVTDDIHGATEIFKKSTRLFPNDWVIQYQAGYHFMLELEDFKSAALYYQNAQRIGAPRWLPLLIARLQTKAGQEWLAKKTLENYIHNVGDDDALRERAEKKLQSLGN